MIPNEVHAPLRVRDQRSKVDVYSWRATVVLAWQSFIDRPETRCYSVLSLFLVSPFTLHHPSTLTRHYAPARAKETCGPVARTRTHARTHTHAPFLTLESRVVIISSPAIAVGKASGSRLEATAISASRKARRGNQSLCRGSRDKRRCFYVVGSDMCSSPSVRIP